MVLTDYIKKICAVNYTKFLYFQRLSEVNLKIQFDKCSFLQRQIVFLGHLVTDNSIKPNPQKAEAIRKIELPKTEKEIK